MPRATEITVPPDRTDGLLAEVDRLDGVLGVRVLRGVSLRPAGDVVVVQTTTDGLHPLMQLLERQDVGRTRSDSIITTRPASIIAVEAAGSIARERSDATWEEMEHTLAAESNMSAKALVMMALAGVIAVAGLSTNALHLVVGAMIIAPAFEPISRIALGIVVGGVGWRVGLRDVVRGYAAMMVAAAAATLLLRAMGQPVLPPSQAYYLSGPTLIDYWTSFTGASLLVSAAAAIVGALLIATNRSVLTAGVLIALALIPTAVLTGMMLALGRPGEAGAAFGRLLADVVLVFLASLLVFRWHRAGLGRARTIA